MKIKTIATSGFQFARDSSKFLPVMESFYSIQGEGANTGMPAFFIRLGGCDVGCHWCDVKDSWRDENFPILKINKIVSDTKKYPSKNVVITGGEPLIYNLDFLTDKLRKNGIKTFLETSGAHPLTGFWDWICLSPKKNKSPIKEIFSKANELKVIICNKDDFRFAEDCYKFGIGNSESVNFFLQPEWSRREAILPQIVEYIKKNTHWKISLQTHKYMNIP